MDEPTRKIAINKQHGGFSLSTGACALYQKLYPIYHPNSSVPTSRTLMGGRNIPRDDPALIKVIEMMRDEAAGDFATLKIVEIPAYVKWEIGEYDGLEWVAEQHRTWE